MEYNEPISLEYKLEKNEEKELQYLDSINQTQVQLLSTIANGKNNPLHCSDI